MKPYLIIFCLLFGFLGQAVAEGDSERGKSLSATCAACHGADGNSFNPLWPKIAGQHENYLFYSMQLYKKGKDGGRYDVTMYPLMQNLSVQDMKDLAAYFASQPLKPGKSDPELQAEGKLLFMGGKLEKKLTACAACHGPMGYGNEQANFPRIGGQHALYLIDSLKKYQSGERDTDRHAMMRDISQRMDESEMQAVANYLQGLY